MCEDPVSLLFFVREDERHWIQEYTGSPITNVGDKLAGMTDGE